jgi:hypothetical protein
VRPDGGARAAAHGPTHDIFRALLPFFSCSCTYLPIIVLHIDGSMRRSGVAAVKLLFPAHTRWRRRVRSVEAHSRLKRVRERAHFFMFLNGFGTSSGSSVLKAAPSSKLRAVESWGLGGPKKLASPWLDRPRNPAIRAVLERAWRRDAEGRTGARNLSGVAKFCRHPGYSCESVTAHSTP